MAIPARLLIPLLVVGPSAGLPGCQGTEPPPQPDHPSAFDSIEAFTGACASRCRFVIDDFQSTASVRFLPGEEHPADLVGPGSLGPDRSVALGSVRLLDGGLYFDLRFEDAATVPVLDRIRSALADALPTTPAFLGRSAEQQGLDGAVAWTEAVPLEGGVSYNDGVAAGVVRPFAEGRFAGASVGPGDLVALGELPFYIPPVAAILTAVPQTPLAHLNLLATARGTPNAHLPGALEHPGLADWAAHEAPAALRVDGSSLVMRPLSAAQYATWLGLRAPPLVAVRVAPLVDAPWTLDLAGYGLADRRALIPLVGGKAAGMVAFAAVPTMVTPPGPLAITVRGYAEHVQAFTDRIGAMLIEPDFAALAKARYAVLEGPDDFELTYTSDPKSLAWLVDFKARHPSGTTLGDLMAAGGLKRALRDRPLDPGFAAALEEALGAHFGGLAASQGLRFRSSSTAEDTEGFNGAGLYDSNTGFFVPPPEHPKRTLAWAALKTWASYWSFRAFEERESAGIDHLSGRMGVLVHPRFDDPLEDGNAVATCFAARTPAGVLVVLVVNAQPGSHSVTNPGIGSVAQPEIDRLEGIVGESASIERVQSSSLAKAAVLSDEELQRLHSEIGALAVAWLDASTLSAAQRPLSVVLDLELKRMLPGWPSRRVGVGPGGLIYKQVRPLTAAPAPGFEADPIPKDLLSRALSVTEHTCVGPGLDVSSLVVGTDPAKPFGARHATLPFVARVTINRMDEPLNAVLDHTQAVLETLPAGQGGWDLRVVPPAGGPFGELLVGADGTWTLDGGTGAGLVCQAEERLISADSYLLSLLGD